ncbi:MAG: D-alanyl-D-alanine carboxypeptidase family protein [Acidimicrobiales bacterium]
MSRHSHVRRPSRRGLFARFSGVVTGLVVACALVVGLQLPLLHRPASVHVSLSAASFKSPSATLTWPTLGSAAIDIPSLGVLEGHNTSVAPIASLTKMMTVYVTLKHLPLGVTAAGPCVVVTSSDVTTYQSMVKLNESSVLVTVGEQLCEKDLLNGVLVHSAGNYAVMLANMVAGTNVAFTSMMNQEATSLGLTSTHYDDVTGYSALSVSTAIDQARLAVLLMKSPLVRSIVIQPSVTLPVAGIVGSFTPYVGVDNVIGVKSGRTAEAGGCDVMAVKFSDGTSTKVLYAVVLGQRGGDLLGPAGAAALALANSAVASRLHHTFVKDRAIGEIAYDGRRVGFGLTRQREVWWWPAQRTLSVTAHVRRFNSSIHRGEVVGHLIVKGVKTQTFTLRALGDLSPPTLLERLR